MLVQSGLLVRGLLDHNDFDLIVVDRRLGAEGSRGRQQEGNHSHDTNHIPVQQGVARLFYADSRRLA